MMSKRTVCILFGGKSGEHEVSLQSAKSVYEAIDKAKYNIILVGIDKNGQWRLSRGADYLLNSTNPKLIKLNMQNSLQIIPFKNRGGMELITPRDERSFGKIDVFFSVMHGTYGEDGAMQGLLETFDAAYVGSGVLGSAVNMDKDVMKRLLRDAGIPTAKFIAVRKGVGPEIGFAAAVKQVGLPFFVKPANLGSSVGVTKVKKEADFRPALATAFHFDTKVLIEEYIEGREIECSVLGNDKPEASLPGEVIPQKEFYSYEAKYIDENGAILEIPVKLDGKTVNKIRSMAIRAFKVLECSGMARADFFLKKDGSILINELNTIPGFTKISMYPKLWEVSGLPYTKLLDRLIELAIEKKNQKDKLQRSYS